MDIESSEALALWLTEWRAGGITYVRIQNRVIVQELLEHQLRVRFEGGIEREEDLAVFRRRQVLYQV